MLKELPDKYGFLEELIPQLYIHNGHGDSFSYWCSLFNQLGSKTVVFLDGDKVRRCRQEQSKGKLQNIPIVSLDEGKEFEELIPTEVYFEALSLETKCEEISEKAFSQWLSLQSALPSKMMFTKKINRWLEERFPDLYYDKPGVMKLALERCNISDIDLTPISKLITIIMEE